MYFGAGVEGKPAGSQSNKVVRGCFAGCKFGPRGLSLFPPPFNPLFIHSSLRFSPSNPAGIRTRASGTHENPSTDVFPPSNVVYRSTSLLFFFFFNLRSEREKAFLLLSPFDRIDGRIVRKPFCFTCFFFFFRSNITKTVMELLDRRNFFLNFLGKKRVFDETSFYFNGEDGLWKFKKIFFRM